MYFPFKFSFPTWEVAAAFLGSAKPSFLSLALFGEDIIYTHRLALIHVQVEQLKRHIAMKDWESPGHSATKLAAERPQLHYWCVGSPMQTQYYFCIRASISEYFCIPEATSYCLPEIILPLPCPPPQEAQEYWPLLSQVTATAPSSSQIKGFEPWPSPLPILYPARCAREASPVAAGTDGGKGAGLRGWREQKHDGAQEMKCRPATGLELVIQRGCAQQEQEKGSEG